MIDVEGSWFKDEHERALMLRGVNLGGSSKVPKIPNGATWNREGFFDHRTVSFVGRPFPLEDAELHFTRLRRWGLTFLRFLVTWEAIEHAGPGQYDEAYLDYLRAVVERASEYDMTVFIDPHQDVWSRFSGGDGAPGWTFEVAGMDLSAFQETGAAVIHQLHGDPLPQMIWPTNRSKLASATLFTLFFAGNDFAPQLRFEGRPVQDYLQDCYFAAMEQVAARLGDLHHVIGIGSMNEPSPGWIGWSNLEEPDEQLRIGPSPTPFQSMLLGAGYSQVVDKWQLTLRGPRLAGQETLNPGGQRAWLDGRECVWRQHGVWDLDGRGEPRLLRPAYFAEVNDRPIDFGRDYLRPFINRFAAAVRQVWPQALIFIESDPDRGQLPSWTAEDAADIVFAPHWYDGLTLMRKSFSAWMGYDTAEGRLVISPPAVQRSFVRQLARFKTEAVSRLGGAPVVIGETGIPFDLNHGQAFRNGDFKAQTQAMDRIMRALDENLLNFTLWNYTADNSNRRGDQWNDEDLSIFSRDQQTDRLSLDSGGRALPAVIRPYARATAGEPLRMEFDYRRGRFTYEFLHDPEIEEPTELFVPDYQYPGGAQVEVSDGRWGYDPAGQVLWYWPESAGGIHSITITR